MGQDQAQRLIVTSSTSENRPKSLIQSQIWSRRSSSGGRGCSDWTTSINTGKRSDQNPHQSHSKAQGHNRRAKTRVCRSRNQTPTMPLPSQLEPAATLHAAETNRRWNENPRQRAARNHLHQRKTPPKAEDGRKPSNPDEEQPETPTQENPGRRSQAHQLPNPRERESGYCAKLIN